MIYILIKHFLILGHMQKGYILHVLIQSIQKCTHSLHPYGADIFFLKQNVSCKEKHLHFLLHCRHLQNSIKNSHFVRQVSQFSYDLILLVLHECHSLLFPSSNLCIFFQLESRLHQTCYYLLCNFFPFQIVNSLFYKMPKIFPSLFRTHTETKLLWLIF